LVRGQTTGQSCNDLDVISDGSVGKYHVKYVSSNVDTSGDKLLQIELKKEVKKVTGLNGRAQHSVLADVWKVKVPKQDKVFIGIISAHETINREKYDWSAVGGICRRIIVKTFL